VSGRRPRRIRRLAALRQLTRETLLAPSQLVAPLFASDRISEPRAISSMPGVFQWPVDAVQSEARSLFDAGVAAVLLFGIPAEKDPMGSGSHQHDGVVQRAVASVRRTVPEMLIITDVCLCEYTSHGHCGLINGTCDADDPTLPAGELLEERSLELLGHIATSHAAAGADVVAPSAMLDGMVRSIRGQLDDAGYGRIPIMSYAAKYASSFYGPFREAGEGSPAFGDRAAHQLNPANAREALLECRLDVEEGADMLMVKPALGYLDILRRMREAFPDLPLAAYNVSGEYAMIKAAAARGWIDERAAVLEILLGMRRAGADFIITYHAKDAAGWLRAGSR
jgi:porphobilinogen synthase